MASLTAAMVFLINPILPFVLIGITHLFSVFLVLNINEVKVPKSQNHSKDILFKAFAKIKEVLKAYPFSGILIVVTLTATIFMDAYFYIYPLLLKDLNLGFEYSGYVFALVSVFSALGSQIYQKYFSKNDLNTILAMFVGTIGAVALISSNTIWAFVVALCIQGVIAGFVFPAFNTFWQPKINKEYRTTLLSIFSFTLGILSTLTAFVAGLLIDNFGIGNMKIGLLVAMLVFSVPFLVWLRSVLKRTYQLAGD